MKFVQNQAVKNGALYTCALGDVFDVAAFDDSGVRGTDAAAADAGKWIVWNSSFVSFSKSSKKKLSLLEIIDDDADNDVGDV